MSIYQLFYVGAATHPYDSNVVQSILQVSRRNNRRLDVTGCLLFSGKHFGLSLEDELEGLLAGIVSTPLQVARTLKRMRPDTVMGAM